MLRLVLSHVCSMQHYPVSVQLLLLSTPAYGINYALGLVGVISFAVEIWCSFKYYSIFLTHLSTPGSHQALYQSSHLTLWNIETVPQASHEREGRSALIQASSSSFIQLHELQSTRTH